jgi:HAD superfamily hydrolase (TIGR01450 family)
MGVGQSTGSDHLNSISTADAFAIYEGVRHRLPDVAGPVHPFKYAATLEQIADGFDVFLLDAFGVLNIGEIAIPGTKERIETLRAAGKRVMVVSNAASLPTADLLKKYRGLGYDFEVDDIVTSRAVMSEWLTSDEDISWGVMARNGVQLDDLGPVRTTLLGDERAAYDAAEGFLLIGSAEWTDARQAMLEQSVLANPRPVLVANPDVVAPREGGFSIEPGYFAHRLADVTGITPMFFGKPFANIYDLAFARLGPVDPDSVLMVGDSIHTDILGARAVGIASALVSDYGFFAGQDVLQAIELSDIGPNFLIGRP